MTLPSLERSDRGNSRTIVTGSCCNCMASGLKSSEGSVKYNKIYDYMTFNRARTTIPIRTRFPIFELIPGCHFQIYIYIHIYVSCFCYPTDMMSAAKVLVQSMKGETITGFHQDLCDSLHEQISGLASTAAKRDMLRIYIFISLPECAVQCKKCTMLYI